MGGVEPIDGIADDHHLVIAFARPQRGLKLGELDRLRAQHLVARIIGELGLQCVCSARSASRLDLRRRRLLGSSRGRLGLGASSRAISASVRTISRVRVTASRNSAAASSLPSDNCRARIAWVWATPGRCRTWLRGTSPPPRRPIPRRRAKRNKAPSRSRSAVAAVAHVRRSPRRLRRTKRARRPGRRRAPDSRPCAPWPQASRRLREAVGHRRDRVVERRRRADARSPPASATSARSTSISALSQFADRMLPFAHRHDTGRAPHELGLGFAELALLAQRDSAKLRSPARRGSPRARPGVSVGATAATSWLVALSRLIAGQRQRDQAARGSLRSRRSRRPAPPSWPARRALRRHRAG